MILQPVVVTIRHSEFFNLQQRELTSTWSMESLTPHHVERSAEHLGERRSVVYDLTSCTQVVLSRSSTGVMRPSAEKRSSLKTEQGFMAVSKAGRSTINTYRPSCPELHHHTRNNRTCFEEPDSRTGRYSGSETRQQRPVIYFFFVPTLLVGFPKCGMFPSSTLLSWCHLCDANKRDQACIKALFGDGNGLLAHTYPPHR